MFQRLRPVTLLAVVALLAACEKSPAPSQNTESTDTNSEFVLGTNVHKLKWRDPNAPINFTAPAGAHLSYYGGHVLSNVKVVAIFWGPNVASVTTNGIGGFFTAVTNSAYFDWLSEYNTNITPVGGGSGTNQSIGRGTFAGSVTITPGHTSSSLQDSDIQAEINSQISAGHLPAPDANTLYMTYFPPGVTITQGGSNSCQAGGFCAYHGTFTRSGASTFYGVMPDMSPGSGCDTGCGGSSQFNNETSVSSHELIEAVTDAEVGLSTVIGPPLAWYDSTNGEIGDICNAQQATIVGYTVQKEFSNVANDCIVSRSAVNDFSIAVSPNSGSVTAGSSASATVSTTTTSGSAQTVNLSASGQPSGATVSFSPVSVSSGGSSTMTISTSTSTPAGNYTITITGTGSSATHTTTYSLAVSGGSGGGGTLTNGGFESGFSGWTTSGAAFSISSSAHSGSSAAQMGATTPTNGDSSVAQTFTLPAGGTGVSFWYKMTCPDSVTYDWATATLHDNTSGTTTTMLARICTTNAWTQVSAAAVGGHSVTLTLTSHDDNYSADPSFTLFDDVAVTTGGPPPGGVTNGGFESGFTGWTTSGASTSVSNTAHTGAHSAQMGTTTPTNGDSSVSQTFTVPAGNSTLTFWYNMTCPDSVTYDWATATLRDNTTSATSTVLARTCSNSGWVQVNSAVTAGHSVTLTLTSHDDNYSADPSFTLFDDVSTH